MKQRLEEFNIENVMAFIQETAMAARKKYFSAEAWTRLLKMRTMSSEDFTVFWQAHVDLFHDIEAALGSGSDSNDPAGDIAQGLANRWKEQMDADSGGDAGVKQGLMKYWADRRNWPALLRWQVEGLHRMTFDRFEAAGDYIDKAVAAVSG